MSESEPIVDLRPALARRSSSSSHSPSDHAAELSAVTVFDRRELSEIFRIYGRMVAAGEWRDYALDMGRDRAVFSVFRRASECPLYRIEKVPRLARRQGAYAVVSATGLVLKRGPDLRRVLAVLDKSLSVVR